jgi:hypothetical protein
MEQNKYLRAAEKLMAGDENMKKGQKIPDFETILQRKTIFSRKVEKSRFFSSENQLNRSLNLMKRGWYQ